MAANNSLPLGSLLQPIDTEDYTLYLQQQVDNCKKSVKENIVEFSELSFEKISLPADNEENNNKNTLDDFIVFMKKIWSFDGNSFNEEECREALSKQVLTNTTTADDQQKKLVSVISLFLSIIFLNFHRDEHKHKTVITIRSSSVAAVNHLSPMTNLNRTRLVPPFDPVLSSTPKMPVRPTIPITIDVSIRSPPPPPLPPLSLSSIPQVVESN
ncbi:unnamed protein product, partial [Didymodactylos carnosus]